MQTLVHHKQASSLSLAPAYPSKHIVQDISFHAVSILSFSRPLELLDSLAAQPSFDMELPDELTLQMLGYLEKYERKIARLMCKVWSHYASKYLFGKLYISPREEYIRVFKLVTQHLRLRYCVKNFEYDVTFFLPNLSKRKSFAC